VSEQEPVAINWKASGRGPRLADFAYLMWGTWLNEDLISAAVNAYRRHVEPTDEELDRLEAVMAIRPLYLMGFDYRRHIDRHRGGEVEWFDPEYLRKAAAATRAAFRR
jgi:Ser/Thr protein kinase RdoA (MazF antagonist)